MLVLKQEMLSRKHYFGYCVLLILLQHFHVQQFELACKQLLLLSLICIWGESHLF